MPEDNSALLSFRIGQVESSVKDLVVNVSSKMDTISSKIDELSDKVSLSATEHATSKLMLTNHESTDVMRFEGLDHRIKYLERKSTEIQDLATKIQISVAERFGYPALMTAGLTGIIELIKFLV